MKPYRINYLAGLSILTVLAGASLSACEKDTDGRPQISPGTPVATKIMPDSAASGSVVTLIGTGLGDIRSVVFEKQNVPAGFQTTLNTAESLIFRVPTEASGGMQNITFTNSAGQTVSVPFKVLAFPSVTDVSNYNFTKGTVITINGNNLDDVTAVAVADSVKGISDAATIVSKEKKKLVVQMPASSLTRGTLSITNATGRIRTKQEFVNVDKAYQIFVDSYGTGFQDGSWGDAGVVSTKEFMSGTASAAKTYQKGNWHLIAFANWSSSAINYSADYTYITGWIKGASADYSLYVTTDASKGGFGDTNEANRIDVKAGVWNYFKIKLSDMDFWLPGKTLKQVGFRIKGPDKQDETFYFDDIMLVK
ncbi:MULTISPECIES: IPT/TIG domain-containing protein [Spirosoma]|uniref:Cell shape determination protein CcmA n=1 Tax=Spirosoma sordidisoli TaxID=2502893 RepID=A0A4Q2UDY1_9BACT|nr:MULTISPECIES: IPT/TIG domain-containing protein [Spirosoma]RYC67164.1 cell shape determination protein CcmA [Spirosoma sordidisoli]